MTVPGADLVIKDLTVEFTHGGYTVKPLDRFSVTVEAGTLVLLLGPSGCGKTTLLSCLGGILKPARRDRQDESIQHDIRDVLAEQRKVTGRDREPANRHERRPLPRALPHCRG